MAAIGGEVVIGDYYYAEENKWLRIKNKQANKM